jgi:FSR family fosmidomycin resistance protein-like MFS transporter
VELLDELVFGVWTAAWPLIRADLHLSYAQVGLLLSLPTLLGNLVEPVLGVLGDAGKRGRLVRCGGAVFAVAVLGVALSPGFAPLLLALALLSPASGAFVGLSQATLMDLDARRHEVNMARWALAGSVGVVAGPLVLGLAAATGAGWRAAFAACAAATALLLPLVRRMPHGPASRRRRRPVGLVLRKGARDVARALRRRAVVRWLVLLEVTDLMLDGLHGFLALYLVDVAGMSGPAAGVAIAAWTGVGLLGDALLIPLLRRVDGLRYLRASAAAVLLLYPTFLLAPGTTPKLVLLAALGLLNAGWYAIPQGRLYSAMPGRSATVMTLGNVAGLVGGLLPLGLGLVAERHGLSTALWLILAAPAALLVGLPSGRSSAPAGPVPLDGDRSAAHSPLDS